MELGRRDDYIVAETNANTGKDAFDSDGKIIVGGAKRTVEFWGDIADLRSNPDVGGGKRRNVRMIIITCDSRDVEDLTIDFTLTYGGSTDRFQVKDIHDSKFRFTSEVIAEYVR